MYVCVHMFLWMHVCVYVFLCVYTYICMFLHNCMYVQYLLLKCACTCAAHFNSIRMYVLFLLSGFCVCVFVYMNMYIYVFLVKYIWTTVLSAMKGYFRLNSLIGDESLV